MSDSTCHCCGKPPGECTCWEFPGWGRVQHIEDLTIDSVGSGPESRLGEWRATAICGNDITSSCLYVSALAALYAGPLAPLALLLVAAILYLFRGIYAEVGSALPLNGGAYNVLLNTTTKARAALAACLTLLSYTATAVISGTEAMHYAADLSPGLNAVWATPVLLGAFALLNIMGISDSATVALGIFAFHVFTLIVLVLLGVAALFSDPTVLIENLKTPIDEWPTPRAGSWGVILALFFGFSAAMLGISGFESSANYIEEQQPDVFPKTLRNMWIAVAIFNPLISLLSFALLPMADIAAHKEALLSEMGSRGATSLGGFSAGASLPRFVANWISVDAVVVLSGAVLTSYVGVTGLVRRMSMDLCMPQFLLQRNRWRGTHHWIIVSFLLICCSILLVTAGRIEMLAGVYTLSFLSVMALFAVGNLLLKSKRPNLGRSPRAGRAAVLVALAGVSVALIGNVLLDPNYVRVFVLYLACAVALVGLVFARSRLLTWTLRLGTVLCRVPIPGQSALRDAIASKLQEIQCRSIIFVAGEGTEDELRSAAEYVRRNEQIRILRVVWCYVDSAAVPPELPAARDQIDREFPTLHIDLLLVRGRVEPALLTSLARRLGVAVNFVFVGAATAAAVDDLASWGGVRIVA